MGLLFTKNFLTFHPEHCSPFANDELIDEEPFLIPAEALTCREKSTNGEDFENRLSLKSVSVRAVR